MPPQYKLTYFDLQGVCEPIRYILSYTKADWEEKRITSPLFGDPTPWNDLKPQTNWGVLPILEEGGNQLFESIAISRYLGRKHGLGGSNDWDNAKLDEYIDAMVDVRTAANAAFREKDEAKKAESFKNVAEVVIPKAWKKYDEILKKNGTGYLVGKKLTYADIVVVYYVEKFTKMFGIGDKLGSEYPELKDLVDKVNGEPGIKEWIQKRPVTPL